MRVSRCNIPALVAACCLVTMVSTASAEGPLQGQLRLLTHNVFGKDEENCHQRYAAFGHIVANADPPYDIVGLQEYYDNLAGVCPDSGILSDAMWCTGRYKDSDNYYRFYPETFLNSGGIGIFSMGSICDFQVMEFSYQSGFPEALQGTILARVLIPGTTVTVDAYVTHLHARFADDCDRCCRKGELEELADFIATHSARSGNPVIVIGDFNTGGPPSCCGNAGYDDIMDVLGNPRDMWYELNSCGTPRPRCGNPANCANESTAPCNPNWCAGPAVGGCFPVWASPFCSGSLGCINPPPTFSCPHPAWSGSTTDECLNELGDGQERIDFIFVVTDPALTSSAFQVQGVGAEVVNWTGRIDPPPLCPICPDPPPFFGHVSDHFGVEATINLFGDSAVWVDSEGSDGNGTSCDPFATLAEGVSAVLPGNRVLLRPGIYPEAITIHKHLRLEAIAGMATISP